jgi:tellurite resistance-related uncharacterized protein
MIRIDKHHTDNNQNIFVFSGDVKYFCLGFKEPTRLIEVYNYDDTCIMAPPRRVCEISTYPDKRACVELYNCEKERVDNIIKTELEGYEIEYEDANYIFDRNQWLLSFLEEGDVKVMKIDDEHLTYDGQYLCEERIFNKDRLIEVREYYRDKNGEIKWETESYTDD